MKTTKDVLSALVRAPLLRWAVRVAASVAAPRQAVGAVGVCFDSSGRVLLAHHMFRTDFPWGLPGGWVERNENPADTVVREFREELGVEIAVGPLLIARQADMVAASTHPPHVGLAFYCRLSGGAAHVGTELLDSAWCDPRSVPYELAPFQREAITLGSAVFERGPLAPLQSSSPLCP